MDKDEELIFLRGEVSRLKEDLRISNKQWKFENERIQLSLNGALDTIREDNLKLKKAEFRVRELTVLLNIATQKTNHEEHDVDCNYYAHFNTQECSCWLSTVKKELCR
ncbi:MAG TPA: hypothetical protein VM577_18800 [Anaerovoracaceae bacterium]|nr:hypothetical protein [Anaerovoracaceae bacterium]